MMAGKPAPIILDTDIGGDIDDTWALAFLLKCPELDLKLVVTDFVNNDYRTRIAAKLLDVAGRSDIPVATGISGGKEATTGAQEPWISEYQLEDYPGIVHQDGVNAIIEIIMSSPDPVTLIAIGPAPNIRTALETEPRIAPRTRFVGMFGSIRKDIFNKEGAIAEWNVLCDIPSAKSVFTAPWLSRTITPLDTCGRVQLRDENYAKILTCPNPLTKAVIENYRLWTATGGGNPDEHSSILYDTVAVYLAFSEARLEIEELGIRVTDDGFTRVDPVAPKWRCATSWLDLPGFEDFLVSRLISTP